MRKFNLFEILLRTFEKTNNRKPHFKEYVAIGVLGFWFQLTLYFLARSFVLLTCSIILLLISIYNEILGLYYLSIILNSILVIVFVSRFWKWLREPIFTIDGKLPDENWYDEEKGKLLESLGKKEISNMQFDLHNLKLVTKWFLNIQQLKLTVPKNIFQTFTSRVITTLLFSVISYAIIYYSLFLINDTVFFHISKEHLSSSSFITFLYYSFVTLATVGYGDIYPIHFISKSYSILEILTGIILLIVGLSTLSIYTLPKIKEAQKILQSKTKVENKKRFK